MDKRWKVETIASGNLSVYTIDDGLGLVINWSISEMKDTLHKLYGDRVKYDQPHIQHIQMDEWFQDVWIDEIRFNLGNEFGITRFMAYTEDGNKYIREIDEVL